MLVWLLGRPEALNSYRMLIIAGFARKAVCVRVHECIWGSYAWESKSNILYKIS